MKPALALPLAILFGLLLAPMPANAAGQQVMIMGYAFSPANLTVRAGDSITWTNHDQAAHDVAVSSGPAAFHSPLLSTGQSWTFTFTAAGSYAYICSVHPDMRAQIVVLAGAAQPVPAPVQRQQPVTRAPVVTTTTHAAAPAPPVATQPAVTTTQPPAEEPQAQAAAVVGQRLDPMLVVAGIVAAVAVLCLLLLGARPET
jgi:plastocyanin